MPLTDKAVLAAKPKEKNYRLYDRDGLYLEVSTTGGKWWRLKYRLRGKENRISLGTYPQTTLQEARRKAAECKDRIAMGLKPGATTIDPNEICFEDLCREWFKKYSLFKKAGLCLLKTFKSLKSIGVFDVCKSAWQ